MSNTTAVDVFLGQPLVDASEKHFLQRVRRDLSLRGIRARVLANIEVANGARQIDFAIVTDCRAILCELKGYGDPFIARVNGPWERIVNGRAFPTEGNPYRQAQVCGYDLSDEMRSLARTGAVPEPTKDKFVKDLDLVVCVFPSIHADSKIQRHHWVSAVGYEELLARLEQPGARPPWQDEHWEAFIRHLGLYRDLDDDGASRAMRASAAVLDEYGTRFVHSRQSELPVLVPTSVVVDEAPGERPELAAELTAGHHLLLHGASGQGKSLWAGQTAVALARGGHVPIWLSAAAYDGDFSTFLARAVAPYTTQTPAQLIAAARAAGRTVVLVVDGLNECPETSRPSLLDAVQAVRLRASSHSVLVTTQHPDDLPAGLELRRVGLLALDDAERRAILAALGAERLRDALEGFTTPMDLALAAACAEDVSHPLGLAELIDMYVERIADGEATRAALRSVAWRMHQEVRLSLRTPDVVRSTRRALNLSDEAVRQALACRLLTVTQGRVAFRHERFARFLAAEELLLRCDDGQAAGRVLNEPRSKQIRQDAVSLEGDEARLGEMLAAVEDDELLLEAAHGRLGELPRRNAHALLVDALHVASARTSSPDVRLITGMGPLDDSWETASTRTPAETAQLVAAGRGLRRGLLLDEAARLVEQTDALCAAWEAGVDGSPPADPRRIFVATYAFSRPDAALSASIVVRACVEDRFRSGMSADSSAVARTLLARTPSPGPGILYLATSLLRLVTGHGADLVPSLVAACLGSGIYHLQLEALQLVEESARDLDPDEHEQVLNAVLGVKTDNNIFLSTSVVEALAALGQIEPRVTVDDLLAELRELLARHDDPLAWREAAGAISSQFEEEEIVGPYYEAVGKLAEAERSHLFEMALRASDADNLHAGWLLAQLESRDEPRLQSAVSDFLARVDPLDWVAPQLAMESTLLAVGYLARAGLPRPATSASQEVDAWETFIDLLYGFLRGAGERPDGMEARGQQCRLLLTAHRPVLADLLWQLHVATTRHLMSDHSLDLEDPLIRALGDDLVAALVWSLEHPEKLRTAFRASFTDDRGRHIIKLLADIGDARAANVLRRFVDDPVLGEAAVEGVRAIEARG
jgi:hypothetical protein